MALELGGRQSWHPVEMKDRVQKRKENNQYQVKGWHIPGREFKMKSRA